MGDGEGCYDHDERTQSPEWNDQAGQEQEMIGTLEDVPEAGDDEAQRCLMPARVEIHAPDVAMKLERPGVAVRWHEAQRRRHLAAQAVDAQFNRELGAIGLDWIFEHYV